MSEAPRACATITLAPHALEFRCPLAALSEDRPFAPEDVALLESWAKQYQRMARQDNPADELLRLGGEMFTWLNGPTRNLSRILDTCQPPLLIEFIVSKEALAKTENGKPAEEAKRARAFLSAPWELLAADGLHWALRDDILV